MADNILKGIIQLEAKGVPQAAAQVARGVDDINTRLRTTTAPGESFGRALQIAQTQLTKTASSSNQATFALSNLGRVAQDAPFGFLGIANNLNPLLESFQRLKATTGSTGGALKALAGSLNGAGGLGLALSVVSSLAIVFSDTLFRSSSSLSKFSEVIRGAKDSFVEAKKTVSELTTEIDLAKNGFISKEGVINHYNETIGKTTGLVKSLDQAEQGIIKNGEAYIRVTFLKSAANIALGKAAEQAFKIEQELQNTTISEFRNKAKNKRGVLLTDPELKRLQSELITLKNGSEQANSILRKIQERELSLLKADDISTFQKREKEFEKIGNNLLTKAADISKEFKLNFQGDTVIKPPSIKIKPQKSEFDFSLVSVKFRLPVSFSLDEESIRRGLLGIKVKTFKDILEEDINKGIEGLVIKPNFKRSGDLPEEVLANMISLGEGLSAALRGGFESGIEGFGEGLGNILSGKKFGNGLTDAISGLLKGIGQALIKFGIVKEGFDKIFGPAGLAIPGAVAIGLGALAIAASSAIKNFGGARALGGPVQAGKSYIVGEDGPEVFSSGVNGSIIPNNQLSSYSGGGIMNGLAGRVVFEINGNKLIGVLAAGNRSQGRLI